MATKSQTLKLPTPVGVGAASANPPSSLIIATDGYTDASGGSAQSNALPPQFHATGNLMGFDTGKLIFGLLYDTMGSEIAASPPIPSAPSWSVFFDLTGLGLTGATVNYALKIAYDDSPGHDHASDRANVTVVFP
jgi:hypothetical protein